MSRQHGITTNTTENLLIDSGAVYINYGETNERLLGATRGGNTFLVEQEVRKMEFDGMRGEMVGSHRMLGSIPKITANIVEFSWQTIVDILAGSTKANISGTHYRITREIKTLLSSDYFTNVCIVGECTASDSNLVICGIKNAVQLENVEFGFADKDESVVTVTFSGCTDISDLDTEPWWIDYPVSD